MTQGKEARLFSQMAGPRPLVQGWPGLFSQKAIGSQPEVPNAVCQAETRSGTGTNSARTVKKRKVFRNGKLVRKSKMADATPTGRASAKVPPIKRKELEARESSRPLSCQIAQACPRARTSPIGQASGIPTSTTSTRARIRRQGSIRVSIADCGLQIADGKVDCQVKELGHSGVRRTSRFCESLRTEEFQSAFGNRHSAIAMGQIPERPYPELSCSPSAPSAPSAPLARAASFLPWA